MIFSTTAQLKDHVGGAANQSLEIESIAPSLKYAYNRYIIPYIGATTAANLADYVAADETPTNADLNALLPIVRAALGPFGIAEYSKVATVQLSEMGLFQMDTGDKKAPYKYQETGFRESMMTLGYDALESMILWLEKRKDTYLDWESEVREYCRALFVSTAADLRAAYSAYIDRATYESLRPLLEDIENFLIRSAIGEEQFAALKTLHLEDMVTLTYAQTEALRRLRKAISLGAIQESIRRNIVQIKEGRIIQTEALEPQSYLKEGVPSNPPLSLASDHLREWKERHLSFFLAWLNTYPSIFPEYKAYLDAIAAAEAEAEAAKQSDCTTSTGGELDRTPAYRQGSEYCPPSGNGIISF